MTATNWYVLTGAPSSGKTTLLNQLERLGYRVIPEVARALIESEIKKGQTLEKIRADKDSFENRILKAKIAIEADLPKEEVIVFDRAIADSIAYFEMAGLDPKEAVAKSPRNHYRKVFLLARLPYRKDHVRIEKRETADMLDRALGKGYSLLGYDVIRIEVMPAEDRLQRILQEMDRP